MNSDKKADLIWDGVTKGTTYKEVILNQRNRLADAARNYDWETTLAILTRSPDMVNTTRLDGKSLYTPLHQAANGGAPAEVVEKLLALGAWRTIRNAAGETPDEIARKKGHPHLTEILTPVHLRKAHLPHLEQIQKNFHALILSRAAQWVKEHELRLPELEPLLEYEQVQGSFGVPGMHGGFTYWLEGEDRNILLMTESWMRVVGGSGQRHVVTAYGYLLVDEGFV